MEAPLHEVAVKSRQAPATPAQPARAANAPALSPLASSFNGSPRVAAQRALSAQLNERPAPRVFQRAVPDRAPLDPKPEPETGAYRATGGRGTLYNSDDYPRSTFKFGTNTRFQVLSRREFNPQYNAAGQITSVRAANGRQVEPEGVQLDHKISWHNIAAAMDAQNAAGPPPQLRYSLWDARMYYNDQPNLHPVLAAHNAAAGAAGVAPAIPLRARIGASVGRVTTAWHGFQDGLNAVEPDLDAAEARTISARLDHIAHGIEIATDEHF